VNVNPFAVESFHSTMRCLPLGPLIAIHVTSRAPIRSIPPEYVETLCKQVIETFNVPVIIFGKLDLSNYWTKLQQNHIKKWNEHLRTLEMPGLINLVDKLNIEEMVALCSMVDLIVTSDTAPYHIAAALQKPCLALFGNIPPYTRTQYYPTVKSLFAKHYLRQDQLTCCPCFDVPMSCEPNWYSGDCMRIFTPDLIVEEMKSLWIK